MKHTSGTVLRRTGYTRRLVDAGPAAIATDRWFASRNNGTSTSVYLVTVLTHLYRCKVLCSASKACARPAFPYTACRIGSSLMHPGQLATVVLRQRQALEHFAVTQLIAQEGPRTVRHFRNRVQEVTLNVGIWRCQVRIANDNWQDGILS